MVSTAFQEWVGALYRATLHLFVPGEDWLFLPLNSTSVSVSEERWLVRRWCFMSLWYSLRRISSSLQQEYFSFPPIKQHSEDIVESIILMGQNYICNTIILEKASMYKLEAPSYWNWWWLVCMLISIIHTGSIVPWWKNIWESF
jgi:hypothetical protein